MAVVFAAQMPFLAVRLAATYVRFLTRRRRGVRTFRATLRTGGLSADQADALTRLYEEATSMRRIVRGLGRATR